MQYLAFLILIMFFTPCTLYAAPENRHAIRLHLAKIFASEAGFQIDRPIEDYTDDPVHIVAVYRNRSQTGKVTFSIMRAYSPKSFNKNRKHRKYIPFLHLRRSRPKFFPANLPWNSKYYSRFRELYNLADSILSGEVQTQCDPAHWGATKQLRRKRLRQGWTLLDCGETHNDFWRP